MTGVGVVGYGYWGPNLARVFSQQRDCTLRVICDASPKRLEAARLVHPLCEFKEQFQDVVGRPDVDLVVIATPVSSHFKLASEALRKGKDVLVCKPMTDTAEEGRALVELARENRRILAVDHTYLFTGGVMKMKEMLSSGALGDVLYFDSVRVNLGLFQHDVSVIHDLAPHDLSILGYLTGKLPTTVQAMGSSYANPALVDMAYLHLEYSDGMIAHLHLNWMAPVKVRRVLIGCTKQMIVFDDLEPTEKVKVYDKGIILRPGDSDSIAKVLVDYRTGDMVAPKVSHREALSVEAEAVLGHVRNRTQPLSDGEMGLGVVRILEAAHRSLDQKGARIALETV